MFTGSVESVLVIDRFACGTVSVSVAVLFAATGSVNVAGSVVIDAVFTNVAVAKAGNSVRVSW